MRNYITRIAGASLIAMAAMAMPAAATSVSGADFTATHSGKCIDYTGPTTGNQCYNADGSASYNDKRWGEDADKWEVPGDEVCVNWAGEPG